MALLDDLSPKNFKSWSYSLSQGFRSSQYLGQSVLGTILLGRRPSAELRATLASPQIIIKDLAKLFKQDLKNIEDGKYKYPPKWIERPLDFSKLSLKAIRDLWKVRKREQEGAVLDVPATSDLPSLPRYYRQTFHYQTDGWLSDDSAELYDHQVEVVFGGGAAAMRRRALIPLLEYLDEASRTQKLSDLKVLDLASGTGSFAEELKHNRPELHLTLTDLSPYYLKKARERMASYSRIDFVEAMAEALPFKASSFDALVNIFLFHELPERIRKKVAAEMHRVLKRGGFLVFEDSMQLGDKPVYDPNLKHFPVHYHEPYYLSFIKQPLEELFLPDKWEKVYEDIPFLSKIVAYKKL